MKATMLVILAGSALLMLTGCAPKSQQPAPRVQPAYAEAATEREVLDLALTPDQMARYEGTYGLPAGWRTVPLRIFTEAGQLMGQAAGQRAFHLRYQGDHVFIPSFDDRARLVFIVENDTAQSVVLHQEGGVYEAKRER